MKILELTIQGITTLSLTEKDLITGKEEYVSIEIPEKLADTILRYFIRKEIILPLDICGKTSVKLLENNE